jgi:hypothetical protein
VPFATTGYSPSMSTYRERRYGYGLPARAALARVVTLIAVVVAAILVIGILLVVLGANQSNTLVDALMDAARWLAGPFRDLFSFDNHKTAIAVNWGIAAVVYLAVGRLLARLMVR